MPHKHVRVRDPSDKTTYNLPPDKIANPLPVGKHGASVFSSKTTEDAADEKSRKARSKAKRKRDQQKDDTPKAFARLMAWQSSGGKTKLPSGLDNGDDRRPLKKKQKKDNADGDGDGGNKGNTSTSSAAATAAVATATAKTNAQRDSIQKDANNVPKIQPGEKLADFAARVDQALPVSGLARRGGKKNGDLGERQTKTEKRLQKMYADWRVEDARIKEKLEEARELAEEEEEDDEVDEETGVRKNVQVPVVGGGDGGGKKRRKRMIGEERDREDDPWAELKLKRDEPKGLHDVAQAPPEFKAIPREKFKVRNGAIAQVADVPNAAGSLKRREELGAERMNIIEQYRAMMNRGTAT